MAYNWDAFVVRAADEAALAKVKEADPRAIALPGGFARLKWDSSPDWTRSGTTIPWSTRFGEAWMFCAAGVSGVFAYEHGREGRVLRTLGYYPDEGWVVAEGEPEPWEETFFHERQLENCRQVIADAPGSARWPRELADLEAQRIVVGNHFPIAEPEHAMFIAKQMGTELLR